MVGGALVGKTDGVWAFDRLSASAAVARPDGSVDVFDLSAGARVTERIPGTPSTSGRPSNLAIASKRERTSYFVVTGTSGGELSIGGKSLSFMKGGKLGGLEFSKAGLFACGGKDNRAFLLSPEKGKILRRYEIARDHCGGVSALAIASDAKRFVVCSQNISVLNVETCKKIQSLSGHAAPISSAKFFANDTRLVTASVSEQYLYIWDLSLSSAVQQSEADISYSSKKKRKRRSTASHALQTLIAPEQGVCRVEVHETSAGSTSIAALLKSGAVVVWANWSMTSKQTSQCSFVLYPCAEDSEYAAPTVHGILFADDDNLSIVYGNTLKPEVVKINIRTSTGSLYLPKPSASNLLISHTTPLRDGQVADIGSSAVRAATAEEIVPEAIAKNASGATKLATAAEPPTRRRKREKKKTKVANGIINGAANDDGEEQDSDVSSEDESEDSSDDAVDDEPTLSEKLKALGVSDSIRKTPFSGKVSLVQPNSDTNMDSRAEVIMQGLNTKDDRLLNSVIFSELKYDVVVSTVRKLPANIATGQLLDVLDMKMRDRPRQIGSIVPWIQAVLCEHATSLISQPKSDAFRNLMDTVMTRNETLDGLNRLEGRLELIVSQTTRTRVWNKQNLREAIPQLEYVEQSSKKEDGDRRMVVQGEEDSSEESELESDEESSDESDEEDGKDAADMEVSMANGRMAAKKPELKANGRVRQGENAVSSESEDA